MLKSACVVSVVGVLLVLGSACAASPAVEVKLGTAAFDTTGGNLFNCSSPGEPAKPQRVSGDAIGCEPETAADGSFAPTPVTVTKIVGCGDGNGAVVTVTCFGNGKDRTVSGTVTLGISSSCSDATSVADAQSFAFQDVAPGDVATSSAPVESCAVFDNLCSTSQPCAFNSFSSQISVSNTTR